MGRGDTRVSDSESVRREKVNGRERKWESLLWERERRHQKNMFSTTIDKDHIYRRCNAWEREIVFQKFFLENNL